MNVFAPHYSLIPLENVHTTYLFLDEKTRAEKGFALLTRARQEGDRFKLRELDMLTVEQFQKIHQQQQVVEKSDQHVCDYVTAVKTTDDKLENDTANVSNYAMMTAPMTAKELADELLFGFDKKNVVKIKKNEVAEKVSTSTPVLSSKKLKKKRLVCSAGAQSKADKESKLKLPPGWSSLSPAELAMQMRSANVMDKDSPEYGRISSIVDKLEQHPAEEVRNVEEVIKPTVDKPRNRIRKRKRKSLNDISNNPSDSLGAVQDGPKAGKDSKLKLPPGWSSLRPAELALQMRTVNCVDKDSPEYGRISSLVDKLEQQPADEVGIVEEVIKPKVNKPRVRLRKRKSLNESKPSVINPIKLPKNWEQSSPETLAAQLRSKTDLSGKTLTKVFANLENASGNPKNIIANSGSVIKLPANWAVSDPQTLAENIKASNALSPDNTDLAQMFDKLQNKESTPIARKFPHIMLPVNWEKSSPQALAASIQASAAPGQQVSGLLARLTGPVERSRAPCLVTRQTKDKTAQHVKLPADWQMSLLRPADLADKIRDINSDKTVPAALIDRLKSEDERSRDRKLKVGSSASHIMLPHKWHHSSSQELARKIKAKLCKSANSTKKFSKLFSRLENQRSQAKKSAKCSPIKLPSNWANSSPKELVRKISSNQNVNLTCLSKIQANLTRPKAIKYDSTSVLLPLNWEYCTPEDLRKALEEKSDNGQISQVLENLKERKQDSKSLERTSHGRSRARNRSRAGRGSKMKVSSKSKDCPVIKLPENWTSYSLADLAAKIKCGKSNQNNSQLDKIVAELKKSNDSDSKSTRIKLPANWLDASPQLLAENIRKHHLDPHTMSRLLANLESTKKPNKEGGNSSVNRIRRREGKLKKPRSKDSERQVRAYESQSTRIKLPSNWLDTSPQLLAESIRKQHLDPHTMSRLLANLESAKQPNKEGGNSGIKSSSTREGNLKKPIQLPLGWHSVSPELLASRLLSDQNDLEMDGEHSRVLRELIEKLKTQRRDDENCKGGHTKRKVIHQKHTKLVHKKMRENRHMERKKDDLKKKSNEEKSFRNSGSSNVLQISAEEKVRLLEPSHFGWRRECTIGVTGARLTPEGGLIKEKIRIDIYYWPPSTISRTPELPATLNGELKKLGARRIKNIQELKIVLENKDIEKKTGLTLENFSFKAKILDLGEFEYVRYTNHAKEMMELDKTHKLNEAKENYERNQVVESPEDLFGEISDLDDDLEENIAVESEELSKNTGDLSNIAAIGEERRIIGNLNESDFKEQESQLVLLNKDSVVFAEKENESMNKSESNTDELEMNPVTQKDELSSNTNDKSNGKVSKKGKERIKLVIESFDLQKSLSLGVKPEKPISKALGMFCTKFELEMESLQFWCGGRRLSGEEKNSSLEEGIISVTLERDE